MIEGFNRRWVWGPDSGGAGGAADGGNAGSTTGSQDGEGGDPNVLTYEGWVKDQPENVRAMLGEWERGLKTALKNERDARDQLQKQLRDLTGKAEKGSELQTELTKLADQMAETDRRAGFYEAAHTAGVSNLKLAYLVAVQDELFDKKGNVNFEAMKSSYPELFGGKTKPPEGNAGAGTNGNQPAGRSMNEFIRTASGRK